MTKADMATLIADLKAREAFLTGECERLARQVEELRQVEEPAKAEPLPRGIQNLRDATGIHPDSSVWRAVCISKSLEDGSRNIWIDREVYGHGTGFTFLGALHTALEKLGHWPSFRRDCLNVKFKPKPKVAALPPEVKYSGDPENPHEFEVSEPPI